MILTHFNNVYCARAPMFYPNSSADKNCTRVVVLSNRKVGDTQYTDSMTLVFWGKRARVAACCLDKGSEVHGYGELRTYSKETGKLLPDGRPILQTITEINVREFSFGRESFTALVGRVNANIAKAKAEGKIPPQATITAEELLKVEATPIVDFNPELAAQTGRYGNARVYIKPGTAPIAQPAAPIAAPAAPANPQTVEELQAQMAALKAQMEAVVPQANAAGVDPFAG